MTFQNICFGPGLGDVLEASYGRKLYQLLSDDPDHTHVYLDQTDNPFLIECFEQHPCRHRFDLRYSRHECWPQYRLLRYDSPHVPLFYSTPAQDQEVRHLQDRGPYVVFCPEAREERRYLPRPVAAAVLRTLRVHEYRILAIGRSYHNRPSFDYNGLPDVEDLTDRLTIPQTIELVAGAQGVVTAYSAPVLMAWFNHVPTLIPYPTYLREALQLDAPLRSPDSPDYPLETYTFGRFFDTTVMEPFDTFGFYRFDRRAIDRFLEVLR